MSGGIDKQAADLILGGGGDDTFLLSPGILPEGTTVASFVDGDNFGVTASNLSIDDE